MKQQDFLTTAKGLSLAPSEKAIMKEFLMEALEKKGSQSWFQPISLRFSKMVPACMAVLLMGSGVSFAAESAVPGDFLYRTKVSFNEGILLRTETTAEGRARIDAFRINRRLQEARTLAEKSRLTSAAAVTLQEKIDAHAKALEIDLETVASADANAANSIGVDVQTSVDAHEHFLMAKGSTDPNAPEKELWNRVRKVHAIAEKVIVKGEVDISAKTTTKKALQEITSVRLELGTKKNGAVTEALLKAEADLAASHNSSASAGERLEKAKSALTNAKEAKIMIKLPARVKLKGGSSTSGSSSESSAGTSSSASTSTSSSSTSTSQSTKSSANASVSSQINPPPPPPPPIPALPPVPIDVPVPGL